MNINELSKWSSIYIMPMDAIGVFIYHLLKRSGIDTTGFLDNNINKQHLAYDNTQVLSPHGAYALSSDAVIIICSLVFEKDMRKQLQGIGFQNIIYFDTVFKQEDTCNIVKDIRKNELDEKFPSVSAKISDSLSVEKILNSMQVPLTAQKADSLILPAVALMVTRRCTLKCEHCAGLMQYYKCPQDDPLEQILKSIDFFIGKVDFIGKLQILGGEPFLRKDLSQILEKVSKHKNIGTIVVTTNATIVPSEEVLQALKTYDITVEMSYYGELSRHIKDLNDIFDMRGIPHYTLKFDDWFDFGLTDTFDVEQSDTQNKYENCVASCTTIIGNKFSRCGFLITATELKAIPFNKENFIDLNRADLEKKDIIEFLGRKSAFSGCKNCSGYNGIFGKKVPVAVQAQKALPYKLYD